MSYILPDLNLLEVKSTKLEDDKSMKFVVEPLSPGYGVTVGNTLRRILLSSLEGAAIKSVKIAGASHEFSTLKGVKEDMVDLILNLKTARFKLVGDGPVKIELSVKGPKKVTVSDFKKNSQIEPVDPSHYIASLEKNAKLEIEIEIDRGRGYVPVEKRTEEKLPIGTIMVDSIYTPVKKVKFDVENARVGGMTNYNRLILEITTDGTISPQEALKTAASIMNEHLQVIVDSCQTTSKPKKETAEKKTRVKKTKEE